MSPSLPRPIAALLGLVLLAAPLAGCGDGPTLVLPDGHLSLRLTEFRITPQQVSVPAGPITLSATNVGILTHNVAVEAAHRDSSGNPVIYASTPTLLPGQTSATVTVALGPGTPLPRGRYLIVSTIANQADLGMNGTLTVR